MGSEDNLANDFTSNPWIVDTPAATILSTDQIRVRGVRWVGATTAGHAAEIQDQAGKVKWSSVASGANYVEADLLNSPPIGFNANGLKVPTLASGKLYIEIL